MGVLQFIFDCKINYEEVMVNSELMVKKIKFKSISEMFELDRKFSVIAGPCAVENLEQMEQIAKTLVENKVNFIRGGAFKPRTSPYSFQGLELEGLKILDYIRKKYHLLTVSEILDPRDVELGLKYIDIIQIGSRNMMNYALLKEVGQTKHPVLLKRGMMATVDEFLLSAEYIVSSGNNNLILCERGIRTFESSTRNTLDISCVAIIKNDTTLPIVVDLSHSLGRKDILPFIVKMINPECVDGLMVEMHLDPENAKSDSHQQVNINEFINYVIANIPQKCIFYDGNVK